MPATFTGASAEAAAATTDAAVLTRESWSPRLLCDVRGRPRRRVSLLSAPRRRSSSLITRSGLCDAHLSCHRRSVIAPFVASEAGQMFRFVWAFVASLGLAAGQFQLSLLSSLQPPPEPRTLLRPPPPPPPPSPSTPAVASRRPPLLSHARLTGLAPPPPPTQFTASPPDVSNPFAALLAPQSSEDATPLPALSSPTTIRFTIDDVPGSFEPSLFPPRDVSLQEDLSQDGSLASLEASRFSLEDEAPLAPPPAGAEPLGQLFFLTSKETREPEASPGVGGRAFGSDKEALSPLTPYLGAADADFKPSLYFPFLLDSTEEPQNEFTLIEERNPRISSFLRPQPPQFYESSSDVFILKPVKVVSPDGAEESEEGAERPAGHGKTKTPVPVMVDMDGDKDAPTTPKATKPPPTRKTLHFDEEFLSLLRNAAADKGNKPETSSQASPFWLDLASEKGSGAWRLKGAEAASPPTRPRAATPSNSVQGGFFTKSIKSLTSSVSNSFNISSTSLTANSTENLDLPTEALFESEGPKIVSVGEVGEVPHDLEGAHTHTAPATLSASLKHGVQALNVSARTSGCPKLYGKVELMCDIHHDASDDTSMKMMWKKKSFLKGRPEEQIVAEDSNLMLEDSRLSLKRLKDSYSLVIKDFRPKDCGTYECEVRAADTVAASQLLLFTCL